MQTDNPIWETTSDDRVVPVRVVGSAPMRTPTTKRSPAALFGITIMVFAGFMMFGGMRIFSAQVVEGETKITISDDGVDPMEVTIKPGQRIRWTNNGSIPHVLESSTLKDEKGEAMETTAIFPGSEIAYDLPTSTVVGTYEYISRMSKKINGRIIVQSVGSTTPTTTMTTSSSSSSIPVQMPPVAPVAAVASSSAESSVSSVAVVNPVTTKTVENLPFNPNTVGNTTATITKNIATTAITAHRPTKQPESGTSEWIIALCAVAALCGVLKKASI